MKKYKVILKTFLISSLIVLLCSSSIYAEDIENVLEIKRVGGRLGENLKSSAIIKGEEQVEENTSVEEDAIVFSEELETFNDSMIINSLDFQEDTVERRCMGGTLGENLKSSAVVKGETPKRGIIDVNNTDLSDSDFMELLGTFREVTENFGERVNVSEYNITEENIASIYEKLVFCSPRSYYLTRVDGVYWFYYGYDSATGDIVEIIPIYTYYDTFDKTGDSELYTTSYTFKEGAVQTIMAEVERNLQIFDSVIADMQSYASKNESDFGKLVAYHDYIVTNFEYNYEDFYDRNPEDRISNNIMYFILNRSSVCQSYAMLYNYVLMEENMPTGFIVNYDQYGYPYHVWNIVKLYSEENNYEGKWYQIDVTWDDQTKVSDKSRISYRYFLLGADAMRESHASDEMFYEDSSLTFGTEYDDCDWHDAVSSMVELNNAYYYVARQGLSGVIRKYTPSLPVYEDIYTYNGRWTTEDGTKYFVDVFSGLSKKDGRLYFNNQNTVYILNLENNIATAIPFITVPQGKQIFGSFKHKDRIYYSLSRDWWEYGIEESYPIGMIDTLDEQKLLASEPIITTDNSLKFYISAPATEDVYVYVKAGNDYYVWHDTQNISTSNIREVDIPMRDISDKDIYIFIWNENFTPYTLKYKLENRS